jgi:hypothetical protein
MQSTSEYRVASLKHGRAPVLRLLLIVSGAIFVSQLAVQYAMTLLPPVPSWADALLHSRLYRHLRRHHAVAPFALGAIERSVRQLAQPGM